MASGGYYGYGQQQPPPPPEAYQMQPPQNAYYNNGQPQQPQYNNNNNNGYNAPYQPPQGPPPPNAGPKNDVNVNYGGPPPSYDEVFAIQKPKWNDLWAGILFLATCAGFVVVSALSIQGYCMCSGCQTLTVLAEWMLTCDGV